MVKRLALPVQKLNCNPDLNMQLPKTKSEPMETSVPSTSSRSRRSVVGQKEKDSYACESGSEKKRKKQKSIDRTASARDTDEELQQQLQQHEETAQKEERDAIGDTRWTRGGGREQRGDGLSPQKQSASGGTLSDGGNAHGPVTLEWSSERLLQALLSNSGWLRSVRLQLLVWAREVRIPTKMSHLDLSPDYRMLSFGCTHPLLYLLFSREHFSYLKEILQL